MLKKICLLLAVTSLVGCSAVHTAINKSDLAVETRMSNAVVLEPMAASERIVYVRVRDTSGNGLRKGMQNILVNELAAEGIRTTKNPKEANLMLNATILQAGRSTEDDVNSALKSGFSGAALGAGVSLATGGSYRNAGGVGLAAGAIGFLADTMVDDVYYSFILDVELRERPLEGDQYENASQTNATKGTSTLVQSNVKRGKNYKWIIYKTRVVTTANKMNLKLEEALPLVQKKTASSLAETLL